MKTAQPSLFDESTIVAKRSNSKCKAMLIGNKSTEALLENFTTETRVTGLTNGSFSLISLIQSLLKKTGPANVIISTWSAGFYDSTEIYNLLTSHAIIDFKIILDRSFKTRQVQYSTHLTEIFNNKNIRSTNTHSKFVLIYNETWNVCVRTSMNLNENKRCENFDIDNDIEVFNLFKDFSDKLFQMQPEGIIESREIVDPIFNEIFKDETEQINSPAMQNNNNDFPTLQDQISEVLDFINIVNEIYKPAYETQSATHYFSTEELYTSIKEINPGSKISKESVYQAMTQSGYIYRPRPGSTTIDMKWLLQLK